MSSPWEEAALQNHHERYFRTGCRRIGGGTADCSWTPAKPAGLGVPVASHAASSTTARRCQTSWTGPRLIPSPTQRGVMVIPVSTGCQRSANGANAEECPRISRISEYPPAPASLSSCICTNSSREATDRLQRPANAAGDTSPLPGDVSRRRYFQPQGSFQRAGRHRILGNVESWCTYLKGRDLTSQYPTQTTLLAQVAVATRLFHPDVKVLAADSSITVDRRYPQERPALRCSRSTPGI
jgi:hypothetical protein